MIAKGVLRFPPRGYIPDTVILIGLNDRISHLVEGCQVILGVEGRCIAVREFLGFEAELESSIPQIVGQLDGLSVAAADR